MLFGPAFEKAALSPFLREDAAALFREWSRCKNHSFALLKGDSRGREDFCEVTQFLRFLKATALDYEHLNSGCKPRRA
jgi:hypothetical protein